MNKQVMDKESTIRMINVDILKLQKISKTIEALQILMDGLKK